MDNKRIISLSILIVALSIAYYFVIFIPQRENQQAQQLRILSEQENIKAEQQKEEEETRQQSLNTCLSDAQTSYLDNWNSECKSQGKLSASCIELTEMTYSEYVKKNKIPDDKKFESIEEFYKKRDECSCRLPLDNSDRLDGWRKDAKDECYRQYGD